MPEWEMRVVRHSEQTHPVSGNVRTVGTYEVWWNGARVDRVDLGGLDVPLSGTTAEAPGPGSNLAAARDKQRIATGRYRLATWDGIEYQTFGYSPSSSLAGLPRPGIHLLGTEVRTKILIHPGKNAFLSSVGCINPCTRLPGPTERISYAGSRRRVIALIEHMKACLGTAFPNGGGEPIPDAWIDIAGEP